MIANATENVASVASEEETDSPVSSEEECSAGKEVEDVNAKEYFTDTFAVKGSFFFGGGGQIPRIAHEMCTT